VATRFTLTSHLLAGLLICASTAETNDHQELLQPVASQQTVRFLLPSPFGAGVLIPAWGGWGCCLLFPCPVNQIGRFCQSLFWRTRNQLRKWVGLILLLQPFYGLRMTSLLKCPNVLGLCPLASWVKGGREIPLLYCSDRSCSWAFGTLTCSLLLVVFKLLGVFRVLEPQAAPC